MDINFDAKKLINSTALTNELDYERALIIDRKLRLLSKDNEHFKNLRIKLRNLIEDYENKEWNDVNVIDDAKIEESQKYEQIAELERVFIEKRKQEIRNRLKEFNLNQNHLALLLGHKSKTHMSELINGIKPFTLKDLLIISRMLKIDLEKLIPKYLPMEEQIRIKRVTKILDNPKLKLSTKDLLPTT